MKWVGIATALPVVLLLTLGIVEGFNTRTARVELPNGVYFHNLFLHSWDDNVIMRASDGDRILSPDVVLVKYSDTHVFIARRRKGERNADEYYVYEVATDTLEECGRGRPCRDLLLATGISPDDEIGAGPTGRWWDWHDLTRPGAGLVRHWWDKGSAGGLRRTVIETIGFR
jgi:hypothetical protein